MKKIWYSVLKRLKKLRKVIMINTIKQNKEMIMKIAINQFGMAVFGLVLYMASSTAGQSNSSTGNIMKIVTSLFAIGFYMVLLYTLSKEEGLKDQIRIESGRKKRDNFRFLKVSLLANAWNILLGVILIVSTIAQIGVAENTVTLAGNIGSVAIILITFTEGMYIGILQAVFNMNCVASLLIVVPAIVVCTVGYIAGTYGGFRKMLEAAKKKK